MAECKKELFIEILDEIEHTDPDMFKPQNKLQKGDKKLADLNDNFLRKCYALLTFYRREADQCKTRLSYERDNESIQVEWSQLDAKADILYEIFWYGLRSTFETWKYRSVGVRADWKLVLSAIDDDETPNFLKKLLGL